ncbi:hypothetical protein IM774_08220 [Erysipelotrichaceae bacterium RD49]|nr:hypothetical protein [Erysipelotrichaceae bacterium RD49]
MKNERNWTLVLPRWDKQENQYHKMKEQGKADEDEGQWFWQKDEVEKFVIHHKRFA